LKQRQIESCPLEKDAHFLSAITAIVSFLRMLSQPSRSGGICWITSRLRILSRVSRRSVCVAQGILSISPVLMRTASRTNAQRPHKKESDVSEKNDLFVGAARSLASPRARSRMHSCNVRACVHMYIDEGTYRDGICRQPRCTFAVRGRDHPGRFSAPY